MLLSIQPRMVISGISAIGAGFGGSAAIYGSTNLKTPKYPDNYIYAGFFDGNVKKGTRRCNGKWILSE